jgi:hypothetical protein
MRAKLGQREDSDPTLAWNFLTSKQAIWVTGLDTVAAKLMTGKPLKILKAIKVIPHGVQSGLAPVKLHGQLEVDPHRDDLAVRLVQLRASLKTKNPKLAGGLKVAANSAAFGILCQMDVKDLDLPSPLHVFSGEAHIISASASDQLIVTQLIRVWIGRPLCCRARGAGALGGDVWILSWGGVRAHIPTFALLDFSVKVIRHIEGLWKRCSRGEVRKGVEVVGQPSNIPGAVQNQGNVTSVPSFPGVNFGRLLHTVDDQYLGGCRKHVELQTDLLLESRKQIPWRVCAVGRPRDLGSSLSELRVIGRPVQGKVVPS